MAETGCNILFVRIILLREFAKWVLIDTIVSNVSAKHFWTEKKRQLRITSTYAY